MLSLTWAAAEFSEAATAAGSEAVGRCRSWEVRTVAPDLPKSPSSMEWELCPHQRWPSFPTSAAFNRHLSRGGGRRRGKAGGGGSSLWKLESSDAAAVALHCNPLHFAPVYKRRQIKPGTELISAFSSYTAFPTKPIGFLWEARCLGRGRRGREASVCGRGRILSERGFGLIIWGEGGGR